MNRPRMSFMGSLWVVLLGVISVVAAISARAESLVLAPEGFRVEDRFVFEPRILGGFAGLAYSPAGEPIVYEGGEIRLSQGSRHVARPPRSRIATPPAMSTIDARRVFMKSVTIRRMRFNALPGFRIRYRDGERALDRR